jgi:hypothetical protein
MSKFPVDVPVREVVKSQERLGSSWSGKVTISRWYERILTALAHFCHAQSSNDKEIDPPYHPYSIRNIQRGIPKGVRSLVVTLFLVWQSRHAGPLAAVGRGKQPGRASGTTQYLIL